MSDVKHENRNRALIVEDEFLIALDLEATMTGLGFEICGLAPNAEEARSLAMDHQPDVVVIDVYLGGAREGIETARWLRDVCDASVVFVTAYTDDATLERIRVCKRDGQMLWRVIIPANGMAKLTFRAGED